MGLAGLEPATPGTQNQNHTKLDYNPVMCNLLHGNFYLCLNDPISYDECVINRGL